MIKLPRSAEAVSEGVEQEMRDLEALTRLAKNIRSLDYRMIELDFFVRSVDHFLTESRRRLLKKHDEGESRDDGYFFSVPFPHLLHSSVLVTVVAFVEQETRGYANALKGILSLELSLNDLSGSWIERFKKYCTKAAHIEFELEDDMWQEMQGIIEMRNCIVHNNGMLDGFAKNDTIKSFVFRHGTPAIENNQLRLSRTSSDLVLKISGSFIRDTILSSSQKQFPVLHDLFAVVSICVDSWPSGYGSYFMLKLL